MSLTLRSIGLPYLDLTRLPYASQDRELGIIGESRARGLAVLFDDVSIGVYEPRKPFSGVYWGQDMVGDDTPIEQLIEEWRDS